MKVNVLYNDFSEDMEKATIDLTEEEKCEITTGSKSDGETTVNTLDIKMYDSVSATELTLQLENEDIGDFIRLLQNFQRKL